jgi:hypothetical protein
MWKLPISRRDLLAGVVGVVAGGASEKALSHGEGTRPAVKFTATGADWLNVRSSHFMGGAAGNGIADDTAPIAAAVAAAQASHCPLYLPAGTYLITKDPFAPGNGASYTIMGDGPGVTVIRPSRAFAGAYAMDLTFAVAANVVMLSGVYLDLSAKPTLNGIRIGNTGAGVQTSQPLINNVQVGYGATALTIEGGTVAYSVRKFHCGNMTISGIHITNSYGTSPPTGELSDVLVENTVTSGTAQGVLIDAWSTGTALNNLRVLGHPDQAIRIGINVYHPSPPVGGDGDFIQATNCVTDATTGPGLALTNCRQVQSTNNFWSCLHGSDSYGVAIDGGQYFRFVNDEIAGCGVSYTNGPDDVAFTSCEFPATGTIPGAHHMPGSSPPTNLQIDRQSLSGRNSAAYQLTNDLPMLYAALTDPAAIGAAETRLADGPVFEALPARFINTATIPLTAGETYMGRIWLPKGLPVTRIVWMSGDADYVAGTGVHYWSALYAASGGVANGPSLGQSADNTAPTIRASSLQVMPLATPYVISGSGYYYIALHLSMTGGTMPNASGYLGLSRANDLIPKTAYIYDTGYASATAPTASGPGAAPLGGQVYLGVS